MVGLICPIPPPPSRLRQGYLICQNLVGGNGPLPCLEVPTALNGVCKWAALSVRQTNLAWEIPNIAPKKFEITYLRTNNLESV